MRKLALRGSIVAACAGFQVWALLRFYRRFVFDERDGRVFGLADDVYISACFGRSLFQGAGFVWYPGAPKVEGVSNPLWSALIGLLHILPGFAESRLGVFVIALNVLMLAVAWWLFWRALETAELGLALVGLVLSPWTVAVAYWSAEGFEIALLALLAMASLAIARRAPTSGAGVRLGLVIAAGLATRMDFVLVAVPSLITYGRQANRRQWLPVVLAAGLPVLALLSARYAYYGAWLPNTYWLKATGWPLHDRLARGVEQNRALLQIVLLPWLALLAPSVRRQLWAAAPHALAAWFGFALTVAYSVYVGGDSWRSFAGYDRHTAVGGLLFVWGLTAAVLALRVTLWQRLITGTLALGLAAWPVVTNELGRAAEGLFSAHVPERNFEREWIQYGRAFEHISRPGGRIAVCPAGAIVYFSHRGGVDLLGKVDPFVARLRVAPRRSPNDACWRDAPGHNKEDDVALFQLRQPEFSRHRPPQVHAGRYDKVRYQGQLFFALRSTPFLTPELER